MVKHKPLDELVIVTIKNIADFDFTPELGAMFAQRPFFIKQGDTLQAPEPAGYRLAVNLAKAILNKRIPTPEYGKGDDRSSLGVYSDEDVQKLVAQIIVGSTREEKAPVLSESDRIAQKIEELNKLKETLEEKFMKSDGSSFNDKAEVIAELEKREIKFDKRKTKAELEKLLAE